MSDNDAVPQSAANSLDDEPFVIHSINGYTNMMIEVMAKTLKLSDQDVQKLLRHMHREIVSALASKGVNYADLSTALTPRGNKHEIAFVFDSSRAETGFYGGEFSTVWLTALAKTRGPKRTAISQGDVIGLRSPDE